METLEKCYVVAFETRLDGQCVAQTHHTYHIESSTYVHTKYIRNSPQCTVMLNTVHTICTLGMCTSERKLYCLLSTCMAVGIFPISFVDCFSLSSHHTHNTVTYYECVVSCTWDAYSVYVCT